MKRTPFVVNFSIALVLAFLVGCGNSDNSSMTGTSTGQRSLSGQVVTVGDLAGASPAGITVTAQGQMAVTGAAGRTTLVDRMAVTDAAGRFTLTGLSDGNVQLGFSRDDGIAASLMVGAGMSTVVVDLQKRQASIDTGGTSGGGQVKELEGPITAVSATSITVMNASTASAVTAAITKDTVIRKGNTPLTPSDLKMGDRVHVKTTAGTNGSLTATEIMLQNPA